MFEKLKKYWNKYKKYIIAILILIIGVFLLNFLFVITDCMAGKDFNICAIIYSPVSNEEWLSFFGTFVGGFATFLLFLSAKETLKNEKNKVKYENEKKKFENEKKIVEEYLNALDINEVYNLITLASESSSNDKEIIMKNIEFSRAEITKHINLAKLKLNCNTNFKVLIKRKLIENNEYENPEENEELYILKKNINKKINYLYVIYIEILNNIFIKIIKAVNRDSLEERYKEINSPIKDDKISELFLKIYKEYEKNLHNKVKLNLKEEIDRGDYRYTFYICLDLTVDELTEYFDKKEKKLRKIF